MEKQRSFSVVTFVVVFLGLFALTGLGGLIYLISVHAASEDLALVAGATGTSLGGLCTLLASTRPTNEPEAVVVQNQPADTVPVAEQPRPKPR